MPESAPKISIVIAAWNSPAALDKCLRSLQGQGQASDAEVIVASNYSDLDIEAVARRFPHVSYLTLPKDCTVPELRTAGIGQASGEVVALLEDHCLLHKDWYEKMKSAQQSSYAAVGGAVDNASCDQVLDWAVYFYDYGKYMSPNRGGVVKSLSGNNVSYKRSVLNDINDSFSTGFYEAFIHDELIKRGYTLYLEPDAIVYHAKSYRFSMAASECYHHGRAFAGMRIDGATYSKRAIFLAGSLLLPVLLPARVVARTLRKKSHLRELALSLPCLLALLSCWSLGEFCGYAFGTGASSRKWR